MMNIYNALRNKTVPKITYKNTLVIKTFTCLQIVLLD